MKNESNEATVNEKSKAATDVVPAARTKSDSRPVWVRGISEDLGDDKSCTRTDVWWVYPEVVILDGLDTPPDPANGLYDDRVHLPLRPEFVADIDQQGVLEACTGVVRDWKLHIADGRQRTRGARAANKLRKARGATLIRIRVIVLSKDDDGEVFLLARSLNAFRQDDGPLQVARNFERAKEHFGTTAEVYAAKEGISVATLSSHRALLRKAAPVLLEALDAGTIDPTQAMQIARLPAEEQGAAMATAKGASVEETRAKVSKAKAKAKGKVVSARFSPKEVKRAFREVQAGNIHLPPTAKLLLELLSGEAMPDEPPAWVAAILTAVGREE